MRNTSLTLVAALLLMTGGAAAQDMVRTTTAAAPDGALTNQIDIGLRGTSYAADSAEARYQRYRDLRDGGTVDRFRLSKDTDAYKWNLQADHIGYRDQRFFGSYTNHGNVKVSFDWNQIPLFYSQDTRTLYTASTPGVLSMSDGIQSGIQNKTLTLQNALTGASTFDLRTRRDVATVNLLYSATPNVDVAVTLRNTQKQGGYPWGGSFGIGGAIATELAVPVDHRTTDLGTSLEYAGERGYARVVMIHHPPLPGLASPRKALSDAGPLRDVLVEEGAELVLHGHNHRLVRHILPGDGRMVPSIGVASASAVPGSPRHRAAWHLHAIDRTDSGWTITTRVRGFSPGSDEIGDIEIFEA